MRQNKLKQAVSEAGGQAAVARACGVRQQTVCGWVKRGSLPRTDWTGETKYACLISGIDGVSVTVEDLLCTR